MNDIKIINLNDITLPALLEVMQHNQREARLTEEKIAQIKNLSKSQPNLPLKKEPSIEKSASRKESTIDPDFEDEVDYYLEELNNLTEENIEEKLLETLPSRKNYNYRRIILRLQAEFLKNIKEIEEFLYVEGENIDQEDVTSFKEEINFNKKKIILLNQALHTKEILETDTEENTLLLVPTSSGNIIALNEIEKIPQEYYDSILELLLSIKEGTFKNIKRFNNNNTLNGMCEVKGNATRVAFKRISKTDYAIISIFIKKSNNDKGYQELLRRKYVDYNNFESFLINNLSNPEFMSLNDTYVQELFTKLGYQKEKEKKVVKND